MHFHLAVALALPLLARCSLEPRAAERTKTCVVPSEYKTSAGTADDSPAIDAAFKNCSRNANVVFSEGVNYNVLHPISATNLSNVAIHVNGNLHLPTDVKAAQKIVNDTTASTNGSSLYWFKFAGPNLDLVGSPSILNGWINAYGQSWWDTNKPNGTGAESRPHLLSFNTTNGSMRYYKVRKPIAWNVQLIGKNIRVTDTIIDAISNSSGFPFNTDGFGINAQNVEITNFTIYNGDDAFAIQTGAHNVSIHHGTVGYASHGLSIGSLGQNQGLFANVSDIHFDSITMIDTVYAARFKSWIGGQGLARNISWTNIKLYNVSFPIFVTQTYYNQGSAQTQLQTGQTTERPDNSSVRMENFLWANFTGTINNVNPGDGSCVTDPCWYDVGLPNLKHTESVIVECNTNSSCRNFAFEGIDVWPKTMDVMETRTICLNASAELNPRLGFECANGTVAALMGGN